MDDHPLLLPDQMPAHTNPLAALKPNPHTITLKMLIFKWSASNWYDVFQLFCESCTLWFHLQGVSAEPRDNGDRTDYVLSLLGTTGHRKFNQWKPVCAIPDNHAPAKKSV